MSAFGDCIASGGVVLFPSDTVYGLACDPDDERAVERLYELKGRPARKPAAVMLPSLGELPELGPRTRAAVERLLPGALTLVVPNPRGRWPLASGGDTSTLGVRVPVLAGAPGRPALQSSANRTGASDARRLEDVDPRIRSGADLVIDGGELPGTPSTVVDLTAYEETGTWAILREGAVERADLAGTLDPPPPPPKEHQ